jgi:hypothetical protein
MPKLGSYCKAYPVAAFEQFTNWKENAQAAATADAAAPEYFFLQEDYRVTSDIFLDSQTIFAVASPEWKEFCTQTLNFEIPTRDTTASRTFYE